MPIGELRPGDGPFRKPTPGGPAAPRSLPTRDVHSLRGGGAVFAAIYGMRYRADPWQFCTCRGPPRHHVSPGEAFNDLETVPINYRLTRIRRRHPAYRRARAGPLAELVTFDPNAVITVPRRRPPYGTYTGRSRRAKRHATRGRVRSPSGREARAVQ